MKFKDSIDSLARAKKEREHLETQNRTLKAELNRLRKRLPIAELIEIKNAQIELAEKSLEAEDPERLAALERLREQRDHLKRLESRLNSANLSLGPKNPSS